MKLAHSTAAAVAVAMGLTACHMNTTVGDEGRHTQTARAAAAPGSPEYNRGMQRLQQASDNLRKAIQAMANQPAGAGRNQAIREAHAAILESNEAMAFLYRPGAGTGTTRGIGQGGVVGGTVYPSSDADYTHAMERLLAAAQRYRESIQAMAQLSPGPHRDHAIRQAQEALYDTHQAMIQLPPELRSQNPPGR